MTESSSDRKLTIIESVKEFVKENERFPTIDEVSEKLKAPRRTVRRLFKNHMGLIKEVQKTIDEPLFTQERLSGLEKTIKKHKVFFVSTAVLGAPVDKQALASVKNFLKKTKGALLVMPAADPAANVSDGLDPLLKEETLVLQNTSLNENITLLAIKLSAKQISPNTGLSRIGQRNSSIIVASPKQDLEYVPVSNNKMPHAIMTTGAITRPAYETTRYMSKRTEYIANHDHVMGGVIVEIVDEKFYHFRGVEFNNDGSFTDMGVRYDGNKSYNTKILGMVLGDWHTGHTCPDVKKTTHKMINDLKPLKLVLHDLHQGDSTNHHVEKKRVTKARMYVPTIEEELKMVRNEIIDFSKKCSEIAIVKSNHDEWLARYLEDCRFIDDRVNFRISLDLAAALHDGLDPLEIGINKFGGVIKNVTFLKRDQDYIIGNTQCGAHSDIEGGLERLEKSFGDAIGGHSHTAGKKRRARRVGTSTKLREDYAQGPISWTNTHAIINEDKSVQLINIINGKYRL